MTAPSVQLPRGALRQPGVQIAILALAMAVGFTAMGSFSAVQEGAKAQLHLSDKAIGAVQALGQAVPLVIFSIPIGILVDRTNRVRLVVALAAVWTLGTLMTALAPGLGWLLVARMLAGIGTTGALTAALSLGADLYAPAARGRAMLVMSLGKNAGMALAFTATGLFFGWFVHAAAGGMAPWRGAHLVLAIASLVLSLPLLLLREPPRREIEARPDAPFRVVAGELWARRRFLLPLFVGQVGVVMADAAAIIWAAPVLTRSFHLTPDRFAGWMGAVVFGGGLAGAVLGGLAADWGQRRHGRRGVLIGAIGFAALGIPTALFPISGSVPVFAASFGALILCGTVTGLITSVALTVLIPNELRGLCIGAFISVAGLIGFGAAPILVTLVSGWLGGEAQLAPALALVGVTVSVLSTAGFAAAFYRSPEEPI